MTELELGQATIVYESADGETVKKTVDNEDIVYARDHWHVRTGTDADDNDLMRQIPKERVHRVDRSVEKFEDQAGTVRRRVESLANDIRERIPVDVGDGGRRKKAQSDREQEEARTIPVDDGGSHGDATDEESPDRTD